MSTSLNILQMIESSAHGDEYDGVIFSQLVWLLALFVQYSNVNAYISISLFFSFCPLEPDWFSRVWEL